MLKWFRREKTHQPVSPEPAEPETSSESESESVTQSPPESMAPPEVSSEPEPPAQPAASTPEPPQTSARTGLFGRLAGRLGKTRAGMIDAVRSVAGRHPKIDEETLEQIEDILIQCDVGVPTTTKIVDRMRKQARRQGLLEAREALELFKESIEQILGQQDRPLDLDTHHPMIVLVVGVNGTGKTTTIGKIAKTQTDRGRRVMMVAADTFRAAAADQLEVWAQRTGSAFVRREEGADPASVVYEALEAAGHTHPDLVLIDTAGRLHTKAGLMEQLTKLHRVIARHVPDAPHETILVLDATTGQNALNQVKLFNEACTLTGLVMTKLDGTAKGGILIACKDQYQLPIFKIGIGESIEDLRDFDAHEFAEALFGSSTEKP